MASSVTRTEIDDLLLSLKAEIENLSQKWDNSTKNHSEDDLYVFAQHLDKVAFEVEGCFPCI